VTAGLRLMLRPQAFEPIPSNPCVVCSVLWISVPQVVLHRAQNPCPVGEAVGLPETTGRAGRAGDLVMACRALVSPCPQRCFAKVAVIEPDSAPKEKLRRCCAKRARGAWRWSAENARHRIPVWRCAASGLHRQSTSAEIQAHQMLPLLLVFAAFVVSFTCVSLLSHFGTFSDLSAADLGSAHLGAAEFFFGIVILLAVVIWLTRNDFSGR
jgi:hypothetical protein